MLSNAAHFLFSHDKLSQTASFWGSVTLMSRLSTSTTAAGTRGLTTPQMIPAASLESPDDKTQPITRTAKCIVQGSEGLTRSPTRPSAGIIFSCSFLCLTFRSAVSKDWTLTPPSQYVKVTQIRYCEPRDENNDER